MGQYERGRATRGKRNMRRVRLLTALGIIFAALAFFLAATSSEAATRTVTPAAGTGTIANPAATAPINTAINGAAAGDIVLVKDLDGDPLTKTYYAGGGLNLNRSVSVQFEAGVVVRGNNSGQAVTVMCSECSVLGASKEYPVVFEDFAYGIGADRITGRNRVTAKWIIQRRTNYGFWISGDDWVVEENEVDRIIRRSSGGDADYGRIFGNRHVVRRNWFHGTQIPGDLAPGPDYAHTDCLQYYNQNGEILRDILIEENIFSEFVQGLFIGNETGNGSAVQRVTVRNNVFWGTSFQAVGNLLGRPSWGVYFGKNGPERGIVIENNTFRNCSNFAGILTGTDAILRKNIFADGGSVYILEGTPSSLVTTTPGGNLDWNFNWIGEMAPASDNLNYNASTGKYTGKVNPQFQNTSLCVGADGKPWTTDDGWRAMNLAAAGYGAQPRLDDNTPTPIPNVPPTANAGVDPAPIQLSAGQLATSVALAGSGTDTDGTIAAYLWTGTPDPADVAAPWVSLQPGVYTFTLTVRDDDGALSAADSVTVTVLAYVPPADVTAPELILLGANPLSLYVGDTFTDPGATATDDRDVLVAIRVSGTVNTAATGTYTLTYTATDAAGNTTVVTRAVVVTAAPIKAPFPGWTLERVPIFNASGTQIGHRWTWVSPTDSKPATTP